MTPEQAAEVSNTKCSKRTKIQTATPQQSCEEFVRLNKSKKEKILGFILNVVIQRMEDL